MLSRVRLALEFDATALCGDFQGLESVEWVPHFNTAIYEGDWSGIALRSVGGASTQLYPDPAAQEPFADTETLRRCPNLAAALARFGCELQAARLLRLGPGATVAEHRDYRLGHEDGEVRIHVPLTTNDGVEFLHEGEHVTMRPGEAWYLDLNRPHAVANRGTTDRVHLLVDCVVNEWLDAQLGAGASYE